MNGLRIIEIELSQAAREEVLHTAIDAGRVHGIGYWADVKRIETRGNSFAVLIEDIERAGETDGVEGSKLQMTHEAWIDGDDIYSAVGKMLADPKACASDGWTEALVEDSLDGPLADVIMQVACFGKIIYG